MGKNRNIIGLFAVLAVIVGILAVGCSTPPVKPDDKIAVAKEAINRARMVNANEYAPLDLKFAEDKLKEATDAMAKQDYETARIKAEAAALDANLAETKSRAAKQKKITEDMQDDVDKLRKEVKNQ